MHKIYEGSEQKVKARGDACRSGSLGCVACKKDLHQEMAAALGPMQEKRKSFEGKKGLVDDILIEGSKRAGERAGRTLGEVRRAIHFQPRPAVAPI